MGLEVFSGGKDIGHEEIDRLLLQQNLPAGKAVLPCFFLFPLITHCCLQTAIAGQERRIDPYREYAPSLLIPQAAYPVPTNNSMSNPCCQTTSAFYKTISVAAHPKVPVP
jgi:hypothetical protein